MTEQKLFKLNDKTIAGIMQLLQLSLMTGTDLSDHLRSLELVEIELDEATSKITLGLSDAFVAATEKFGNDMLERIELPTDSDDVTVN